MNNFILKLIVLLPLSLFHSIALAANKDKIDVVTIIGIFIIAQVLSIVGIVSLGFKRKNKEKKKEDIKS